MPTPPKKDRRFIILFVYLNLLRILSILSILLLFSTTLSTMASDARDLRREEDEGEDCEYFPGTQIPTHAWGNFWSELNRTFLLLGLLICLVSETNESTRLDRSFLQRLLPILSSGFGTSWVGLLQMAFACSSLSHLQIGLALTSSRMTFFVGLINLLSGWVLGPRGKGLRSILARRRDEAASSQQEGSDLFRAKTFSLFGRGKGRGRGEKRGGLGTDARKVGSRYGSNVNSMALRNVKVVKDPIEEEEGRTSNSSCQAGRDLRRRTRGGWDWIKASWIKWGVSPPPPSTLTTASIYEPFPSLETDSHRDLLRQRAREANAKAEREQESRQRRERVEGLEETIQNRFFWDEEEQVVKERWSQHPACCSDSRGVGRERGVSSDRGKGEWRERRGGRVSLKETEWNGGGSKEVGKSESQRKRRSRRIESLGKKMARRSRMVEQRGYGQGGSGRGSDLSLRRRGSGKEKEERRTKETAVEARYGEEGTIRPPVPAYRPNMTTTFEMVEVDPMGLGKVVEGGKGSSC